MTTISYQLVFLAYLTLCIAQARLQTIEDPVANNNDGSRYFHENKTHTAGNNDISEYFLEKENHTPGSYDGIDYFRGTENHTAGNTEIIDYFSVLESQTAGKDRFDFVSQPNKDILNVPWWSSFILLTINMFYRQRPPNRSQFGVIYLGNVDNLNQFQLGFYPVGQDGRPITNNTNAISPVNPRDFGNYVVSRPERVPYVHNMVHAEERVLRELDTLWNSYVNRYQRTPNIILLYSWIMPCPNCTNLIIENLDRPPYTNVRYRVVAYTVEGTNSLPYMTPAGNQLSCFILEYFNITVYRQRCNRPSRSVSGPDIQPCTLEDTFQGCMVACINTDICCSCKISGQKSMVVVLVNHLTKACATSDITSCAYQWVKKTLNPSRKTRTSICIKPDAVASTVSQCAKNCVGRPLSKPLSPKSPSHHPGYLTNFKDVSKLAPVDLTEFCNDFRTEGLLCTVYRKDSFTAGNTLCRDNHRCGYHGYKYSWCYVDFSNRWDYCCTGKCAFDQGTDYMWCTSGNTWQYCGDAGEVDIQKRRCLADYPCGMHQERGKESFYWCFVDYLRNWDRCCQPWHKCGKHGWDYNWCYTGYKNNTEWKYCTP